MSNCFDGSEARKGGVAVEKNKDEDEDLPTIHPVVDGRLKDEARS
jgi:hypothetical protein